SSLTIDYDLGWSDVTSVTGYFWRKDDRMIDGTFYDSVYLGDILQQQFGYGGAAIGALAAPSKFDTNVNQIHQELRLSSKPAAAGDRWSWIGGLYYARTRTALVDDEHIPGFNSTFESTYADTPQDVLGAAFPNDLIYYAATQFVSTQKAVFGQATYALTPAVKVTAGARYEKADESLSFNSAGFFSGGGPFTGSAGGSKTTPKVAISYEISSEALLYASATEGFRDGGINRPVPIPLCSADLAGLGLSGSPGSYSADHLWSYEIGGKSRALNDSLSLSGALFDIRWNNIQTDILLPTCTFDVKVNIGSAESRGGEFELRQRVTDRFNVTLGGNYTSAKITAPVAELGVERGDHVPGVPEWSLSSAAEYDQPLQAGTHAFGRLNAQWTGKSQGVIFHNDPDFERPSYLVMGASAGLQAARYEVSFFVSNLLNQNKVIQRPNIAAVEYGLTVRPRTFGIGASYHY
ncbi:MAG TPA: TonB-dependent receptor, partial [Steroidobacteraceae bacterium]